MNETVEITPDNAIHRIRRFRENLMTPFTQAIRTWDMVQPDPLLLSRIQQQYGLGYYKMQNSWGKAIEHYKEAYRLNPKNISCLSTIAYCYEFLKDYSSAAEYYEKYLKLVTPGSKNQEFAESRLRHVRGEQFMEEGRRE